MWLTDRMITAWRNIRKMFGYTDIKRIIGQDVALSESMINSINGWKAMLNGKAGWVADSDYIKSLRIERGICREFSDVVLTEMESSVSNEKLNEFYQKMLADLNENLQDGLGLGSFILKPLPDGKSEFVTADNFIPIKFDDDGKPSDCAFLAIKRTGENQYYTKLERHRLDNNVLIIENTAFYSQDKSDIGMKVSLEDVPEWSKLQPAVSYPGMDKMDFGYYRNPIKNHIDESPCGVSIFEDATDRICEADEQASRLKWEYQSGERAIHVDERALRKKNGQVSMGKLNKRLYRGLNLEAGKDNELLKEYSPDMRDEAYHRGLEKILRQIEFIVGLAYGDLSDVQLVEKTATEVKASKYRKYNRVNAIQTKLETCLSDFVDGLAFWNGLYTSGYEFNCNFNDSILTDEETERQQDRSDMAAGVMTKVEYRMKWYNETEEEAKKHIVEDEGVVE